MRRADAGAGASAGAGCDQAIEGLIFDLDTFAVHDGPGIRLAVYLKGCPLTCGWCHSPESRRARPEAIFVGSRCVFCGSCAAACPAGVHQVDGSQHLLHRERCTACGRCVEACPTWAMSLKGQRVAASAIVERAQRMRSFFAHSGGGITLTGGEVTAQPQFAAAILAGCRRHGIHTAIETCGACDWPILERVVEHADLVLYDVKLMDAQQHRRWTGADNRQILANLKRLAGRPAPLVQVRTPLVPGITDTAENLGAIRDLAAELGLRQPELLPFNPSAAAKYEWLGLRMEL